MRGAETHLAAMIAQEARRQTNLSQFMYHSFIVNLSVYLLNYSIAESLDFYIQKDYSFSRNYTDDSLVHVVDLRRNDTYHYTRVDLVGLPPAGEQTAPDGFETPQGVQESEPAE